MLETVRVVARIQRQKRVKFVAQHILGENNIIADALGYATADSTKLQLAKDECVKRFGRFVRLDVNHIVDTHIHLFRTRNCPIRTMRVHQSRPLCKARHRRRRHRAVLSNALLLVFL